MITPTTTIKEKKLVPEGTHIARCYSIIHIGHIPNLHPQATNPIVDKIRLTWELPEVTGVFPGSEELRPYSISQEYTLSMHEKSNLYKTVTAWTGKKYSENEARNFDVEQLVGMECMLNVSHMTKGDNTFAVINSVMKMPASMKAKSAINQPKIINWDNMTVDIFNSLPAFIQEKMKTSNEYKDWNQHNKTIKGPLDPIDYPEEQAQDIPF